MSALHNLEEKLGRKLDVSLQDFSQQMGMLSLQGPRSRQILSYLTDSDLSNEAFPFSTHQLINVAGQPVRKQS